MSVPRIAGLIDGQVMALSDPHAAVLLGQAMPGEAVPQAAQPERFVIQRGIAVVPIRGMLTPNSVLLEYYLGWTTYLGLAETLRELAANADVGAIVLDVDSPGGFVVGLDGAAEAVRRAARAKPVHALASPLAASAAYWLACQARDLTVTPGGVVGSIGIALSASASVAPGTNGRQQVDMTSTHARAKRPDPMTDEGRAELQRSLDAEEARFHAAVAAGRKISLADLPGRLSVTDDPRDGGAVFSPEEAVARGLADRVETRDDFYIRVQGAYAPRPRAQSRAFAARARAAAALAHCA